MPFKKGEVHTQGGRKGYEFEKAELEKMHSLLGKYLIKVEKVLDGISDAKDYSILMAISVDLRKILDKLHASKEQYSGEVIEKHIYVERGA